MPSLIRYRGQVLCLDCTGGLTRGSPVSVGALLALLHPAKGSHTAVAPAHGGLPAIIGQVVHTADDKTARLTFLMPEDYLSEESLFPLLDELTRRAGEMGALRVQCEINENHPVFDSIRRAGFTTYAWEHIWKLPPISSLPQVEDDPWSESIVQDEAAILGLYQSVVPPVVQCNEDPLPEHSSGWVVRQGSEVTAYAEAHYGTQGILLNTLFHPELGGIHDLILALVQNLTVLGRPVYLAVRLYQAHIERALAEINAEHSPMKALMSKHLALRLKEMVLERKRKPRELRQAEPTAPLVHNAERK